MLSSTRFEPEGSSSGRRLYIQLRYGIVSDVCVTVHLWYNSINNQMDATTIIFEEWKTNLMSLAILFHFLCAQHVSHINISIFRSLRLCWWITKSVVLFCKDGWFSVSVNLRCLVVCVWCDVFCRFVVVGRCILTL